MKTKKPKIEIYDMKKDIDDPNYFWKPLGIALMIWLLIMIVSSTILHFQVHNLKAENQELKEKIIELSPNIFLNCKIGGIAINKTTMRFGCSGDYAYDEKAPEDLIMYNYRTGKIE